MTPSCARKRDRPSEATDLIPEVWTCFRGSGQEELTLGRAVADRHVERTEHELGARESSADPADGLRLGTASEPGTIARFFPFILRSSLRS